MSEPSPLYQSNIARSGSFLLRMMLSANPEVHVASEPLLSVYREFRNAAIAARGSDNAKKACPPETPLLDYYFLPERIEALDCIQNTPLDLPCTMKDRAGFVEQFRSRVLLDSADLAPHAEKVQGKTFREIFDSARNMIASARNATNKRWVGSGDSWAIEFFGPLAAAYKNAKFIVIFRDPRAIISSNLAEVSQDPTWVAEPLSYLRHWRKLFAFTLYFQNHPSFRGRLFVLRHEDLIANPERFAHMLCEFLDVPFHADMIDTNKYYNFATGAIWNGNSAFETTTAGFSTHRATRWREKLPAKVRKLVEHCCSAELRTLGYEIDSAPPYPDAEVIEYLVENQSAYANWRTSLGDVEADLGGELCRTALLESKPKNIDPLLLRRNFLFTEVYNLLAAPTLPRLLSYT